MFGEDVKPVQVGQVGLDSRLYGTSRLNEVAPYHIQRYMPKVMVILGLKMKDEILG